MEGTDQLLELAEIGAAYTGFTAIVGALTSSNRKRYSAQLSFWIMFEFSLATILFALLPFVLYNFAVEPQTIWAACSSSLALFLLLHVLFAGRLFIIKAVREGQYPRTGPIIVLPLISITIVAQSMNAFGILFEKSYAAYFLGLVFFLILASANFVLLLIQIWSVDEVDHNGT